MMAQDMCVLLQGSGQGLDLAAKCHGQGGRTVAPSVRKRKATADSRAGCAGAGLVALANATTMVAKR